MATANDPDVTADYTDRFAVPRPAADRPAEAWMRRALEGAAPATRAVLLAGWLAALGFRPGPLRSSGYVLGWRIIDSGDGHVTLGQRSFLMTARLTLRVTADELVWTTRVHYGHPAARAIWPVVRLIHVRTVPRALRRAAALSRR